MHSRRRRMATPSSASRESTTRHRRPGTTDTAPHEASAGPHSPGIPPSMGSGDHDALAGHHVVGTDLGRQFGHQRAGIGARVRGGRRSTTGCHPAAPCRLPVPAGAEPVAWEDHRFRPAAEQGDEQQAHGGQYTSGGDAPRRGPGAPGGPWSEGVSATQPASGDPAPCRVPPPARRVARPPSATPLRPGTRRPFHRAMVGRAPPDRTCVRHSLIRPRTGVRVKPFVEQMFAFGAPLP